MYSEIVPHSVTAAEITARAASGRPVRGIVFSGGPASVHVDGAPSIDPAVYDLGIPIFGICYGAQLLARDLGGEVARTGRGEYGRTELTVAEDSGSAEGSASADSGSLLFTAAQPRTQPVWMSHFDTITVPPIGAVVVASTPDTPAAAFEDRAAGRYGVQFHPEVVHTPHGQEVLEHFLYDACGLSPSWTMSSIIETQVELIRAQVGSARAICGLSGGVDSAVAAALVHRAIGPQLTCVFVDTGLMRQLVNRPGAHHVVLDDVLYRGFMRDRGQMHHGIHPFKGLPQQRLVGQFAAKGDVTLVEISDRQTVEQDKPVKSAFEFMTQFAPDPASRSGNQHSHPLPFPASLMPVAIEAHRHRICRLMRSAQAQSAGQHELT